jgi:hypothetical protein
VTAAARGSLLGLDAVADQARLPAPTFPAARGNHSVPADDPPDSAFVAELTRAIHSTDGAFEPPRAPRTVGGLSAALLSVEAAALNRYERLGIPFEIASASVADVGRKVRAYGATVDLPWLVGVLRADVLTFGRLQFERALKQGTRALHIPEGDSLRPADVDDALARATEFLGDDPIVCTSWLLDPTLRSLPETSNIVAFVRRFDIGEAHPNEDADRSVAKFVFRRPLAEVLDARTVQPRSSVQRLVVDRLRGGEHWSEPRGILRRPG